MNEVFKNIDSLQGLSLVLNAIFISAIAYLYKTKDTRINEVVDEHKEDLKSFDSERSKTINELTQTLNKIAFSIEKNDSNQKDFKESINKLLLLTEQIRNKLNE